MPWNRHPNYAVGSGYNQLNRETMVMGCGGAQLARRPYDKLERGIARRVDARVPSATAYHSSS